MKNKLKILGISTLVIAGAILMPKETFAYRGNPAVQGLNYTKERHEQMEKAFDTKDYTAWKNLMGGRGRVTQVITKENFAKFAMAHDLAEQGKIAEANKIRAELGLGNGLGTGRNWQKN